MSVNHCLSCGVEIDTEMDFALAKDGMRSFLDGLPGDKTICRKCAISKFYLAVLARRLQAELDKSDDQDALMWAHGFLTGLSDRIWQKLQSRVSP